MTYTRDGNELATHIRAAMDEVQDRLDREALDECSDAMERICMWYGAAEMRLAVERVLAGNWEPKQQPVA